ncbi:zinc finger, CCHC-type containing protein [Tanacetum coccineum]
MVEHNNSSKYTNNMGKRKHQDAKVDHNKKSKVTFWKCRKPRHLKKDCKCGKVGNKANGSGTNDLVNGSFNSLKGNDSTTLVDGCGCVDLRFSSGKMVSLFNVLLNIVNDNIASAFMSTSKLNDSILWHARLGHVHFKRMQDMSKDVLILAFIMDTKNDLYDLYATPSLENKKYFVTFINDASRFWTDRGGGYMDTLYFQFVGIIHETTAPYTSQQNCISERKNKVLKEMANSMLSYSGLSQGFWGEAMLTTCYLLDRVPNKRNKITPYELWTKRKPNLNYLKDMLIISKAFRFYVIELNESVSINSINESKDAIFDENRFSSVPRPSQRSLINETEDIGGSVIPEEVTKEVVVKQPEPELRKSKRNRTPKNFGPEFQLYLIE